MSTYLTHAEVRNSTIFAIGAVVLLGAACACVILAMLTRKVAAQLLPLPAPKPAVTCAPPTTSQSGTLFAYACTGGSVNVTADVLVTVSFSAGADTICRSRYDATRTVPGRQGVYVGGSQGIFAPGRKLPALEGAFAIAGPAASGAGCPDGNWIVELGLVRWTARYSVQPLTGAPAILSFEF